jgi:hypothetical protein
MGPKLVGKKEEADRTESERQQWLGAWLYGVVFFIVALILTYAKGAQFEFVAAEILFWIMLFTTGVVVGLTYLIVTASVSYFLSFGSGTKGLRRAVVITLSFLILVYIAWKMIPATNLLQDLTFGMAGGPDTLAYSGIITAIIVFLAGRFNIYRRWSLSKL